MDQIRSTQQQSLFLVEVVNFSLWCIDIGKARVFDGPGNPGGVDVLHGIEPLNHEELRAVDMIGRECGIGRSNRAIRSSAR